MGFKYYEQNQLMIPMEWKTIIDKDDVVFVLNDLIDNMNIDKLLETYSPFNLKAKGKSKYYANLKTLRFVFYAILS